MDDCSNVEVEDSLDIAVKAWNRMTDAAKKAGYRKGVEDGSDSVFQEGFDKGYLEAFKVAFTLGKFKSLLNAMPQDTVHPPNIIEILDKTRRGVCHICMVESENKDDTEQSFSQVIDEQKAHSSKVVQTLYQYFLPYVEQLNVDDSNLLEIQNHIAGSSKDN